MAKQTVNTGTQYCEALGMVCLAQYDDHNNCLRATQYPNCDNTGGSTSDHIVRCGPSGAQTVDLSDAFDGGRTPLPECGVCAEDGLTGTGYLIYHEDAVTAPGTRFSQAHH